MAETKQSGNRSVVFQLLEQHCARTGYRLHVGDSHGHAGLVESPDGRRWFFKGTHFDLNTLGASEIADDKAYAAHFLEESGIAVPASRLVFSSELGNRNHPPANVLDFAETGGFPLFVKPNVGQEGADVIRVGTYPGLTQTLHMLAKRHAQLLVQEEIRGRELRVIVLDGEVLCAVERHPPHVTGDGKLTLAELIAAQDRVDPSDGRIECELARQTMSLESVPEPGTRVRLLPVANLSSGGSASIVIAEDLAPETASIASRAARTLGLRYAGVDLILPDIASPGVDAVVLEVNAAPGLGNLYRQGLAEAELVKGIYQKVFAAMFAE
ncbi:ATP-dependent carboxylate-amine ligase [Roseibium salinum]|uniref:ATP-dependent carboxylate-amine ligase n=1 Tax=Roseibium salinum TaxID=1604349 RepID=A0ABT3R7A0_9HYPH|nr:ATP-dependent carboxylate-amine ligase [Roseibium sp. DSM 29163]MCX2724898.1 ATP-dependent carboxylate-amine ligase [Roseibium sp. DSM 29163]